MTLTTYELDMLSTTLDDYMSFCEVRWLEEIEASEIEAELYFDETAA